MYLIYSFIYHTHGEQTDWYCKLEFGWGSQSARCSTVIENRTVINFNFCMRDQYSKAFFSDLQMRLFDISCVRSSCLLSFSTTSTSLCTSDRRTTPTAMPCWSQWTFVRFMTNSLKRKEDWRSSLARVPRIPSSSSNFGWVSCCKVSALVWWLNSTLVCTVGMCVCMKKEVKKRYGEDQYCGKENKLRYLNKYVHRMIYY